MFGFFGNKEEVNYKDLVQKGAIILDVRSEGEFSSGSVKGAINMPLDILPVAIKKIADKQTIIITCCASGGRSAVAKNALTTLGYTNVHNGGGWHSLHNKLK